MLVGQTLERYVDMMKSTPTDVARIPLKGRYRDLLGELSDAGYEARGFDDFEPGHRHVILRHDVDACPHRALKMARDEAKMGWSAMYFVLPSSAFYNLLDPGITAVMREILALGHQIGLHLEIDQDDPSEANMQAKAAREATIIEQAIGNGLAVEWMSFHQPTKNKEAISDYMRRDVFGGLKNAYARHLGDDVEVGYRADSGGSWYASHPLDHSIMRAGKPIQLLTHPIWWYDSPESPVDTARAFCDELDDKHRREMKDYFLRRYPDGDIGRKSR